MLCCAVDADYKKCHVLHINKVKILGNGVLKYSMWFTPSLVVPVSVLLSKITLQIFMVSFSHGHVCPLIIP